LVTSFIAAAAALTVFASAAPIPANPRLTQTHKLDPTEILERATRNGQELLAALRQYTYYAELTIETVSAADVITGKFYRFSQISYGADGTAREKIFESKSTLPEDVHIHTNAVNNMARVYRFFVSPESMRQYEFNYIGSERVDELDTFVFDVKPKVSLPDPSKSTERFLKGQIWIDQQDLQVVKVAGQALSEQSAHRTPRFETYYQNYDKYWFPAFTSADDEIRVGRKFTRVIVSVRFTSYKKVDK
jgi:hypothetical protein